VARFGSQQDVIASASEAIHRAAVRESTGRHCERSEAINRAAERTSGLLRRVAPVRKRIAFVAGKDAERIYPGPRKLSRLRVLYSNSLPVSLQVAAHIGTMNSATCSGVSSVLGSSPGNMLARIRVRIGPGSNRLTRIEVAAVSCAQARANVSSAAFEAA